MPRSLKQPKSTQLEWLVIAELPRLLRTIGLHATASEYDAVIASRSSEEDDLLDALGECADQAARVAAAVDDPSFATRADFVSMLATHLMHSEAMAVNAPQASADHASRAMAIAAFHLGVSFEEHRCDA